ncbi:MAG: radical SAM protein [Desulfurococcaceae archaeon]
MRALKISDWIIHLSENSHPHEVVIEVSTRCNLECVHCFRQSAHGFMYKDMSLNDFVKIVDNAISSGVKKLVFSGWGEPMANPRILDMIRYAKSKSLYVVLNTNGTMLVDLAEELVKIGLDELYVSIDAVDVELYGKIRRPGDLSSVSKSIAKITDLKQREASRKPVVKTIFTLTKFNQDQLDKLIEYSINMGIQEIYLSLYIHHPRGVQGADCIRDDKCLSELENNLERLSIKLMDSPLRIWLPNIESYTSRECPFVNNRALYVRVDGRVSPCMFLAYNWDVLIENTTRSIREFIIGDALKESLSEIWRRQSNMIFKLSFNYMPSCLDCNLRRYCSYTLSTETDCWGNVPNCSFCPYNYKFSYCPI